MILGIGTDIVHIERIRRLIDNPGDPFFRRTFTARELDYAFGGSSPEWFLAGRFAAKEAIFKCLRSDGNLIRLSEIEILKNEWGAPEAGLSGLAERMARQKGAGTTHISISYDTDYAIAYAVMERKSEEE